MSLYIRDKGVDELARKAQRLLKTPTKTEAVRQALEREIERAERKPPLNASDTFRKRSEGLGLMIPA